LPGLGPMPMKRAAPPCCQRKATQPKECFSPGLMGNRSRESRLSSSTNYRKWELHHRGFTPMGDGRVCAARRLFRLHSHVGVGLEGVNKIASWDRSKRRSTRSKKGVSAERLRSCPIYRLEKVPTVDRELSASSTSPATIAVNLSAPLSFKCIESQQSARSQKERIGRFRITSGLRE
jgi:hypothetical protein